MTRCAKCENNNVQLTKKIGALEIWKCNQCGYEEIVHVHFVTNLEGSTQLESVFIVSGYWLSKPEMETIVQAQANFPKLKEYSKIALIVKALKHEKIEIGRFTETEINNQKALLIRLGINIELMKIWPN